MTCDDQTTSKYVRRNVVQGENRVRVENTARGLQKDMSQMEVIKIDNVTDNGRNATSVSSGNNIVDTAFFICVIAVQIAIMLSMGAIITLQDIIDHLKKPISILIALISQFVAMPASAFGLINLMQFPSTIALSAMILACCPGGSASNLFAYFMDGDVPLSIMLTTISTLLALGFMPLNLWIYTRQWEGGDQLTVPYKSIAITLAWILVPLVFGMLAKRLAVYWEWY
uniref:Uncharacterized protein n=1 Tax=Strigamia maritima TaxID=126957 RepID=T1IHR9_STRMM